MFVFRENFSEIFVQIIAILYQHLWNFALISAVFILRPYCVENIHASTFICCLHQVRRHVHKRITKSRYGVEKPSLLVFRKPILFTLGLGLTMSYTLGVLVWNFYQTFNIVSIVFWLRFEPQISPTRLAINILFITAEAQMKFHLCVKLFDFFVGKYSSVWPEIFRVLSQIQWRFLPRIAGKNYFWRIFQKFFSKTSKSSTNICEISPYFLQFLLCVRIALKTFTQVLSYVACTQIRKHVHKRITKRRYEEEKLARDLSPDSSHKIGNKYFIDHWQGWKEASFQSEIVWFFSWVNTYPFHL